MQRLVFLLFSLFASEMVLAQRPIVPLNYSSRYVPMLDESLRDPMLVKNLVRDDLGFEHIMQDINLQRQELPTARGLRRLELLESLYLKYQNLSYFLIDVKEGRTTVTANYSPIDSKITNVQKNANYYAVELARFTKSNTQRARAFYHLYTNRYLTSSAKGSSVRSLKKVQNHLNGYLKRRVTFLEGMYMAEYKNPDKGIKLIRSVIGSMPVRGGISGRLVIAKKLAGLNLRGRRVRKTDSSYRKYLAAAAYRSRNLGRKEKSAVFSYTLGVWRSAEGRNASWASYPFKISHFSDLPESYGMIERIAISDMKSKDYRKAISKYSVLSNKLAGSPYVEKIDMRIINLYEKRYSHHKTGIAMQKILAQYQTKYSKQESSKNYRTIRAKHAQLINRELAKGLRTKTTANVRNAAIAAAYRYLQKFASDGEKITIESKIAKIYARAGQHQKAVKIYMALKDKASGKQSFNFLNLAIASQRTLAHWPAAAPWNGINKARPQNRTTLLAMMELKYQSTQAWADLAHIGLLKINLNRGPEAFSDWLAKIKTNPKGRHPQLATGFMALAYKGAKQWQSLEDLSRLAMELRITPKFKGKTYSAYILLADALFFGGKELFAKNDWQNAIAKLKEFTDIYVKDRRRAEGFFVLAQAYHNNANHPESIETLMTLVNTYPNNSMEQQALLFGGEWSIPMAYEEQTIFFYQRFVNKYPHNRKTLEVRRILADLYIGREIYGYAARIYQDQSKDNRVPPEERLRAALAVMDIEARHGEVRHAKWGARQVKKMGSHDHDAMATVYSFETKIAARGNNLKEVRRLESKINRLSLNQRSVREALAQARLILAQADSKRTKAEFFNLGLTDPQKVLDKQYALFSDVKKKFDAVCEIGESSFCAPAMMILSETTKNTLTAIEDISIPQTLDESIVSKFEERKLGIIAYLDKVSREADAQALGITEEGQTTPDWSREVQWTNDEQLEFDQTNSTAGNGFVQWSPVMEKASDDFGADVGDSSW
ncbi:tetratricopeptide repeat protein [Pseudobacteriovorax antillogorgiicola]|uniref:Tetratricopeptide repeat-containing protein n=1 Tax=Pseudobacteriovorax antillogorgiicola TaxID=1513793 RepID=A0A1Y6C2D5_9BACT|nr:hypothetical protein [Pseudobacteriovorax antillogorgiicola]TCS50200.1 hypothetical protein EDD56_11318 [Pseudobacteriovorax antillogorgiicola]SMF32255.1 hypothetical protein SAMN06296036_11017 [Pseudobacteriovorax antillogorgiicola]